MSAEADPVPHSSGPIRGPQSFVAGLTLLALAAFSLWLTSDLPQGTLRAMGPAMLPRWLAVGVGICGVALVVAAFARPGHALEAWSFRGPALVVLAILVFAMTIRPFNFGGVTTPGLGLIGAGPLAILIGGFASPEARLRELLIMGLALTAFCMILFGDLLNLPIPLFPQALSDLFPAGWSNDGRLRATAAVVAGLALLIFLVGHRRPERVSTIDVADHSGRI
jgi:hypothetical protein